MKIPKLNPQVPPLGYSTVKPPPEKHAAADVARMGLQDKQIEANILNNRLNVAKQVLGTGLDIAKQLYQYQYNEQYNKAKVEALKGIDDFTISLQNDYDYETQLPRYDKAYNDLKAKITGSITNADAKKDFEDWFTLKGEGARLNVAMNAQQKAKVRNRQIISDTLDELANTATAGNYASRKQSIQEVINTGFRNGQYDAVYAKGLEAVSIHKLDVNLLGAVAQDRVNSLLQGKQPTSESQYNSLETAAEAAIRGIANDKGWNLSVTPKDVKAAVEQVKSVLEDEKKDFVQRMKELDLKQWGEAVNAAISGKLKLVDFKKLIQPGGKYGDMTPAHKENIKTLLEAAIKAAPTWENFTNPKLEANILYAFYHGLYKTRENAVDVITSRMILGAKGDRRNGLGGAESRRMIATVKKGNGAVAAMVGVLVDKLMKDDNVSIPDIGRWLPQAYSIIANGTEKPNLTISALVNSAEDFAAKRSGMHHIRNINHTVENYITNVLNGHFNRQPENQMVVENNISDTVIKSHLSKVPELKLAAVEPLLDTDTNRHIYKIVYSGGKEKYPPVIYVKYQINIDKKNGTASKRFYLINPKAINEDPKNIGEITITPGHEVPYSDFGALLQDVSNAINEMNNKTGIKEQINLREKGLPGRAVGKVKHVIKNFIGIFK